MASETLLKKLANLKSARFRQKYGQFTVEGRKGVSELIHSDYKVLTILATESFAKSHTEFHCDEIISEKEMSRISAFTTPPGILALAGLKTYSQEDLSLNSKITLCLDGISDPGNLGTIIRTADWFGIEQILMSEDCTDFYNPKCLSATMGSFTRIKFLYINLSEFLKGKNTAGAFLDGINIRDFKVEFPLFLVIGSESHGIRESLASAVCHRITIPGKGGAESLNAAVAAGILMEQLSYK